MTKAWIVDVLVVVTAGLLLVSCTTVAPEEEGRSAGCCICTCGGRPPCRITAPWTTTLVAEDGTRRVIGTSCEGKLVTAVINPAGVLTLTGGD